jgi:hypothetical protein
VIVGARGSLAGLAGVSIVAALAITVAVDAASFSSPGIRQNAAAAAAPQEGLSAVIAALGSFDLKQRTEASRTIRRTAPAAAVPALTAAARAHADSYVRYRSLVLLSGFDDPSVAGTMRALVGDRDDRVRMVASAWFEHHPDASVLPALIDSLATERSEYVRPALTRAIAAHGTDARARDVLRPLVVRGEDVFRGAVIDALGDYHAVWALEDIAGVAMLDGPLRDDAITAIGRIGDRAGLETLSKLQATAPADVKPSIAAAVCLIGLDCAAQEAFVKQSLTFALSRRDAALLRASAHALGVLAAAGKVDAMRTLFEAGAPTRDPERISIALPLGLAALRNADTAIAALEAIGDRAPAVALLRDAFDVLSQEDFEQERFFVAVRRAMAAAPAGSRRRAALDAIARALEI